MTARLETLQTNVLGVLNGITAVTGLTVERSRRHEIEETACPHLNLLDEGPQETLEESLEHKTHNVEVTIEGHVCAATDAQIGPALHALYAAAINALEADKTLGGAALHFEERELERGVDREEGHGPLGFFSLVLAVQYQTKRTDAEAAPN